MNTTEMTSDASKAAGVWGSFTCDLPYWTFEDMLMQIKENHGDVSYLQLIPNLNSNFPATPKVNKFNFPKVNKLSSKTSGVTTRNKL